MYNLLFLFFYIVKFFLLSSNMGFLALRYLNSSWFGYFDNVLFVVVAPLVVLNDLRNDQNKFLKRVPLP